MELSPSGFLICLISVPVNFRKLIKAFSSGWQRKRLFYNMRVGPPMCMIYLYGFLWILVFMNLLLAAALAKSDISITNNVVCV